VLFGKEKKTDWKLIVKEKCYCFYVGFNFVVDTVSQFEVAALPLKGSHY